MLAPEVREETTSRKWGRNSVRARARCQRLPLSISLALTFRWTCRGSVPLLTYALTSLLDQLSIRRGARRERPSAVAWSWASSL
jgi:hypothetical protein